MNKDDQAWMMIFQALLLDRLVEREVPVRDWTEGEFSRLVEDADVVFRELEARKPKLWSVDKSG